MGVLSILLKGNNLSVGRSLPFQIRSHFEKASTPGEEEEESGKSQELFPFVKMMEQKH